MWVQAVNGCSCLLQGVTAAAVDALPCLAAVRATCWQQSLVSTMDTSCCLDGTATALCIPATHLVASDLVWCMACSINLVHGIKAAVLKGHLHEVALHKSAQLVNAVSGAAVVVKGAADLVCVVVQPCRNTCKARKVGALLASGCCHLLPVCYTPRTSTSKYTHSQQQSCALCQGHK